MKNIHVLPTDKPSRLIKTQYNDFIKLNTNVPNWFEINLNTTKQNIYITSDEKIKDGDWFSTSDNKILKCEKVLMGLIYSEGDYGRNPNGCQKIILTTDQDLIADCVQAIDDEFLEWFVNNPSCEFVEVKKEKIVLGEVSGTTYTDFKYKIITPKEQQKQHLIDMMRSDEELGLYDEQETLEEVAERIYPITPNSHPNINWDIINKREGFTEGYKLAQQQNKNLYSEEEVYNLLIELSLIINTIDIESFSIDKWFNQFKKQ